MNDQPLYTLTDMTGRDASSTRHQTIGPIDLPYRAFLVSIGGLAVGILPAGFAWLVIGPAGLLTIVLTVVLAVWLFHARTRGGLQIENYRQLIHRRKAVLNRFMLGSATFEVPRGDWSVMVRGSRPNPQFQQRPEDMPLRPRSAADRVAELFD